MPKYLVHTVSSFRNTYIVEAENLEYAKDLVVCNDDIEETDQEWMGENIVYSQPVTNKQLEEFIETASNGHVADRLVLTVKD